MINDVAVLFKIAVSVGALGPTADGMGVETQNIVFLAFDVLPATVCPSAYLVAAYLLPPFFWYAIFNETVLPM